MNKVLFEITHNQAIILHYTNEGEIDQQPIFVTHTVLIKATGKNVLYFGCRHRNQDFLYKEELGRKGYLTHPCLYQFIHNFADNLPFRAVGV